MTGLPLCFREKIEIDRQIAAPIIPITEIPRLTKEVRKRRSECAAYLKAPKGGTK